MPDAPRHFLVLGTDAPDRVALRERLRPIHRAWPRGHPEADPFVQNGFFAEVVVREWRWSLRTPEVSA